MSSVEYQASTIALASILVARGGISNEEEGTLTFPKLAEELKAILGSSWQQLHTVSRSLPAAIIMVIPFGNLLVERATIE
jgi:hypothetical protein